MHDWQYGCFDAASAILANGRLTVRVEGVQPGPCFDVMLSAYAPNPDSSADVELGLYWRMRSAGCGGPTPYTVDTEIALRGMRPALVRIFHASGYVDLRVRHGPAAPGVGLARPPP